MYANDVEVMFSREQIAARVRELGVRITEDYRGKELTAIGVLKGSFLFFADLVREIDLPLKCDFLGLSSYGSNTDSSGVVQITSDLKNPIEGRHVLVIEDIVDTGLTMKYLLENLQTRRPLSVKVCSLLEKPARAKTKIDISYLGFTIPDAFVVGYGLDVDEKYRNLPFVGLRKGA